LKKAKKTIDTLVPDCEELFTKNTELSNELLDWAAQEFRTILQERFASYGDERSDSLRMSQIGKELRLLYLEDKDEVAKQFSPHMQRLFLYGDIVEILMLVMAKAAGHTVSHEQEEVVLDGVVGHIDCIIDGYLVDVKSTSGRAFEKFDKGTIKSGNDPYGYVGQLAAYAQSDELKDLVKGKMAFFAMEKEFGHTTVLKIPKMYAPNMSNKIQDIRTARAGTTIPSMCKHSDAVPASKSSPNKKIGPACTYCDYKFTCWEGLRAFKYSNRTEYLTEVLKEPNVTEITHELLDKRTKFKRKKNNRNSK
jgi:hypothetical protein